MFNRKINNKILVVVTNKFFREHEYLGNDEFNVEGAAMVFYLLMKCIGIWKMLMKSLWMMGGGWHGDSMFRREWRRLCGFLQDAQLLINHNKSIKRLSPAMCDLCVNSCETTMHALRDCPSAMQLWERVVPNIIYHFFHHKFEWLDHAKSQRKAKGWYQGEWLMGFGMSCIVDMVKQTGTRWVVLKAVWSGTIYLTEEKWVWWSKESE